LGITTRPLPAVSLLVMAFWKKTVALTALSPCSTAFTAAVRASVLCPDIGTASISSISSVILRLVLVWLWNGVYGLGPRSSNAPKHHPSTQAPPKHHPSAQASPKHQRMGTTSSSTANETVASTSAPTHSAMRQELARMQANIIVQEYVLAAYPDGHVGQVRMHAW
jgi:hypothetical protein